MDEIRSRVHWRQPRPATAIRIPPKTPTSCICFTREPNLKVRGQVPGDWHFHVLLFG